MPFATRLPRTIPFHLAVALLFGTSGIMWGVWIARIPGIAAQLDLGRAQLGVVLPAFSIGALIAFPVSAAISSRFGSRVAIRAFGTLRGLLFPLLALAPDPVTLAIALGFGGFAHGALDIALNAQGVEIERRMSGSILSRAHGTFSLGALLGSLGVGLAAEAGLALSLQFAIPGLLAAVIFATLSSQLLDDRVATTPATTRLATKRRWRGVRVPPRALWALGAIALLVGIADEAIADWTTLFIRQDLAATPIVASMAYSIYSLAMLIGRFSGDSISTRVPASRILQAAGAMGAAGLLFGTLVHTPAAMLVGIGIVGLGFSAVYPTLYRLAGNAPGVPRASGLATIATIAYLGFLIGPLIIGPVASATSLRLALIGVGVMCLAVPALSRAPKPVAPTVSEPQPEPPAPSEPNPYSL